MNTNQIQHHGVLGMKWGVRRYQNKDGTRTALGKKKQYDKSGKLTKIGRKMAKDNFKRFMKDPKNKQWIKAGPPKFTSYDKETQKKIETEMKAGLKKLEKSFPGISTNPDSLSDEAHRQAVNEHAKLYKEVINKYIDKSPMTKSPDGSKSWEASVSDVPAMLKPDPSKEYLQVEYKINFNSKEDEKIKHSGINEHDIYVYDGVIDEIFNNIKHRTIKNSSENQLQHHGILGMKWGVRRYQNKDGTRISKGKAQQSQDHKEVQKIKSKKMSERTNEELKTMQKRGNLEADAKRLYPNSWQKGKKAAQAVLTTAALAASIYALKDNKAGKAAKDAFMRQFGTALYMKGFIK